MTLPQQQVKKIDTKVWVIFSDETDMFWIRILKRGFRHCFVVLNDGKRWISFDPMAHYSEITVHDVPVDFDIPAWLERRGHVVIEARLDGDRKRPAPPAIFSCVESVKRILGIHHVLIFTPWQLYKFLRRTVPTSKYPNLKFKPNDNKEINHGKYNIPA